MVLVTGSCGYIGINLVKKLLELNYDVLGVDSLELSTNKKLGKEKFVAGNINDEAFLEKIFKNNSVEAVFHLAAYSRVDESYVKPLSYFENNFVGSLKLINAMIRHGVKRIIYSSSAAVYGNIDREFISENDVANPINPYGETKLLVEKSLSSYCKFNGLNSVSLRYFNVAGASNCCEIGECHNPETHIIPVILKNILCGKNSVEIYGSDYKTRDGTCVRDYVDVRDVCLANILALQKLETENGSFVYNIGSGNGVSLRELVMILENVTEKSIEIIENKKRRGDPDRLVADIRAAKNGLKWYPSVLNLYDTIKLAFLWHKNEISKPSVDS